MRGFIGIAVILCGSFNAFVSADEVLTIAGTGEEKFIRFPRLATKMNVGGPFGITIGPDGALYVCETVNHVVRRIDPETSKSTIVAGTGKKGYSGDGGPATNARLNEPYEVRFDAAGNMFFVEMKNHLVRRVDAKTSKISTVAGTGKQGFRGDDGPATSAQMSVPHSIALDNDGQLYICDIGNHRIRRVDLASGVITTFGGTGERKPTPDGAPMAGTPLDGPRALDFDGKSNLLLALREGNAVYRIDLKKQTLHHLAGTGERGHAGDGEDAKQALLSGPKGIAVGPEGDVYLADTESHTIRVIRSQTGIIETIVGDGQQGDGPDGFAQKCRLARPHGVFVDHSGNVYIGDSSNNRVRKLVVTEATGGEAEQDMNWTRVQLDGVFRSEGVAAADVNQDGRVDVLAGEHWYEAPAGGTSGLLTREWNRHAVRQVGDFNPNGGYSECFSSFTFDVNRDGWPDLVRVGFPGKECYWYENPENEPGHWKEHLIWHSGCNESPLFADVTGNGEPDLIVGSQPESKLGYLPIPSSADDRPKWDFHAVSRSGDPGDNGSHRFYHGLGTADMNNDGRTDVLIPHGWWEGPQELDVESWTFHPFALAKDGQQVPVKTAHLHVEDLDFDGDNDIIGSSAHTYGIWWFENVAGNEADRFRYHLIDDSFSQTHAMHYVDINGDGQRDIVTGKRYFAHNGHDPGGKDAVVMYWYEVRRSKGSSPRFVRHEIVAGRDTGIGTQFAVEDMNVDGRIDIVLSNKKGVNVLLQVPPNRGK